MSLTLVHQTVNPVGATFTPNATVYGWFTLYWKDSCDLSVNFPSGVLTNGQEFIFDIIRVADGDAGAYAIDWDDFYVPQQIDNSSLTNTLSPWDGSGSVPGGAQAAMRHHFLVLNSVCCLESRNRILAY